MHLHQILQCLDHPSQWSVTSEHIRWVLLHMTLSVVLDVIWYLCWLEALNKLLVIYVCTYANTINKYFLTSFLQCIHAQGVIQGFLFFVYKVYQNSLALFSQVDWIQQQIVKSRVKRYARSDPNFIYFNDPKWSNMWYIVSTLFIACCRLYSMHSYVFLLLLFCCY